MERVLGLGGVFLKARDPEALAGWYRNHLGMSTEDFGGAFGAIVKFREREPGYQVWSLFPSTSEYFPGTAMVNFRVSSLDAMLSQLRAAGATVDEKTEESEYGKFGWFTDPEGNRVELWEPPD